MDSYQRICWNSLKYKAIRVGTAKLSRYMLVQFEMLNYRGIWALTFQHIP